MDKSDFVVSTNSLPLRPSRVSDFVLSRFFHRFSGIFARTTRSSSPQDRSQTSAPPSFALPPLRLGLYIPFRSRSHGINYSLLISAGPRAIFATTQVQFHSFVFSQEDPSSIKSPDPFSHDFFRPTVFLHFMYQHLCITTHRDRWRPVTHRADSTCRRIVQPCSFRPCFDRGSDLRCRTVFGKPTATFSR